LSKVQGHAPMFPDAIVSNVVEFVIIKIEW